MTTNPAPTPIPTLTLRACHLRDDPTTPSHYTFDSERYATRDEAQAAADLFPKTYRVAVTTLSTIHDGTMFILRLPHGDLVANGVNGGCNETAIARYHRFLRTATKLGVHVEFDGESYGNGYRTQQDFETAMAS